MSSVSGMLILKLSLVDWLPGLVISFIQLQGLVMYSYIEAACTVICTVCTLEASSSVEAYNSPLLNGECPHSSSNANRRNCPVGQGSWHLHQYLRLLGLY